MTPNRDPRIVNADPARFAAAAALLHPAGFLAFPDRKVYGIAPTPALARRGAAL